MRVHWDSYWLELPVILVKFYIVSCISGNPFFSTRDCDVFLWDRGCYLWCTILWNVGSGYDLFDRKEGIVRIFRWGFPGKSRRIFLRFLMKDIQSIRIEVKEGVSARRVLYMEIR
ncbi:hypothetical protein HID58_096099, partial [Brassica napus]